MVSKHNFHQTWLGQLQYQVSVRIEIHFEIGRMLLLSCGLDKYKIELRVNRLLIM